MEANPQKLLSFTILFLPDQPNQQRSPSAQTIDVLERLTSVTQGTKGREGGALLGLEPSTGVRSRNPLSLSVLRLQLWELLVLAGSSVQPVQLGLFSTGYRSTD